VQEKTQVRHARQWRLGLAGLSALAILAVGTVLGLLGWTVPARASIQTTVAVHQGNREVEVFFSKRPESDADFSAVYPVTRTSPDAGVATAALRALIAGPTPAEASAGYFSEIGGMLAGPSDCGADFTIRIEDGVATVRFCRPVSSAGIGQDARVQSALQATLLQFSTIEQVRLLSREGNCLFDMSGENRCLNAR
jgi:hypothetical protein